MLRALRAWRRERILGRSVLDAALWRAVTGRYSFMRALGEQDRGRLRDAVVLFLHEKSIVGAAGLEVSDGMRVAIAAQACILILNLDLDWYRGWTEIVVYPDEFVAEYDYVDEDGVSHHVREPMSGESWLTGPVILSWADTEQADSGRGYNVVIHEFAHKLDMLNGDANGFPPLHAGMSRADWSGAFEAAYADFCERVDDGRELPVDEYASENPAEFFAVLSEAFFEIPHAVREDYPAVYRQLAAFYRQDPAARLEGAAFDIGNRALKLRSLLIASFGLLLVALTALIALGLTRVESFNARVQDLSSAQGHKIGTISELFLSNGQRTAMIEGLLSAGTREARAGAQAQYLRAVEHFTDAVEKLRGLPVTGAELAARDDAVAAAEEAQEVGERIARALVREQKAPAAGLYLKQAALADSRLQDTLYLLLEANHAETARGVADANQGMRAGFLLLGASGILALLAGAVIAWLTTRIVSDSQAQLERGKELAESTLHSIRDGVITTDAAGSIDYMNPVAEHYLGWTSAQARGKPLGAVYRVIDEHGGQPVEPLPEGDGSTREEGTAVRLVDRDGREIPVRYSHAPILGRDGTRHGTIVVFHDVSQIRAMSQQLMWQANHDALTGLVNRREFERRLAELIETAKKGREHALLYMDLDRFKAVNDTCGHSAGDELLKQLTATMQARMRGSDTLARLGGDEFGALLESCPMDQALRIANATREAVREFRFECQDKSFSVGVSMGLVPITQASGDAGDLLKAADASCYEAKSRGRDRVQVHRPKEGDYGARAGLQIVSQINRAFELGRFHLYRQSIAPVDPARGSLHHEVLVRMTDGDGKLVPATAFMPAAERYNLLTAIERWVVSSLVEYLHRQWSTGAIPRDVHARGGHGFHSVNISGVSINDASFPDFLRNILKHYALPAGLLCFEITETTAIANLSKAAELMREVKGLGCRFALDDFGTGMSSFSYLKHLPVDYVKIAGAFVTDLVADPMDNTIVEAVNRMAHFLGMETVAESVEDAATLARVRELGIDYAQGYYIAKPEPFPVETTPQPEAVR